MSKKACKSVLLAAAEAIEREAAWMRQAYPEPREQRDNYRIIATEDCAALVRRMRDDLRSGRLCWMGSRPSLPQQCWSRRGSHGNTETEPDKRLKRPPPSGEGRFVIRGCRR